MTTYPTQEEEGVSMPFDDDVQFEDEPCPNCGFESIRIRDCTALNCEDGYIDCYEDDAINFVPGEAYETCEECNGEGVLKWCPNCGVDLLSPQWKENREQ